ncbi:MAG TPA: protein phosphatase 2C domain-containing protein [Candidatus Borkfalkia faecipullorum]|uniref:Protein phosphatase 2C domain-containing protein n=1 Tax=Candidatus Borkfalkia faecipullorum TaxID=2838510 RepID=A0A9D1V762_9FIRM|nr:protein phosphatase 2C domain-containing protein [Candidatus Borkfalkia faecipullorum]
MSKEWFLNYGELAGKSHLSRKIPCQDRALCRQGNGVTVAVLSDGCGSSPISQYGSQVTTECLCKLFIEEFDAIHSAQILTSRKMIVDAIVLSLYGFIRSNGEIFSAYKAENIEKYNEFTQKRSEEEFFLDALNATALFAAEKEGEYIIGQIGDGVIGGVVRNRLKIIMEEKKEGEINGTFYPANIYTLALKNPDWYGCAQFQLKKPKNTDVSAFILTSDGVDSFFDLRVPFQKKYTTGVDKLFRCTVEASSFEESKAILDEQFLPALVNGSRAMDDCSVAVIVRKDYFIGQDGYAVTMYERPKEAAEQSPAEQSPAEQSPVDAKTTVSEGRTPECAQNVWYGEFGEEYLGLEQRIRERIGEEAEGVLEKLGKTEGEAAHKMEVMRMYASVLDAIATFGCFDFDPTIHDERIFGEIYDMDAGISCKPADTAEGKYSIYRE